MIRLNAQERAITERVMRVREEAGMTKTEFAERLGLSKQGYQPYEKYEAPFSISHLFLVSRILGRPLEYFLGLDTGLTEDEGQLLASYRSTAADDVRAMILRAVRSMVQEDA